MIRTWAKRLLIFESHVDGYSVVVEDRVISRGMPVLVFHGERDLNVPIADRKIR